jgi:hypothetical protein
MAAGSAGKPPIPNRLALSLIAFVLPGPQLVSGQPAGADSNNMYSSSMREFQRLFCPILSGNVLQNATKVANGDRWRNAGTTPRKAPVANRMTKSSYGPGTGLG